MTKSSKFEHDLFLSYAREDRDTAAKLVAQLELAGLDVWWDADLKAGQQFHEEILMRLSASRRAAVLWSRHSIDSAFVLDEASRALEQGKLIPITLDSTKPPLGFGAYQMLQMVNNQPDASALIDVISESTADAPLSHSQNYHKPEKTRNYLPVILITLPVFLVGTAILSETGRTWLSAAFSNQAPSPTGPPIEQDPISLDGTNDAAGDNTGGNTTLLTESEMPDASGGQTMNDNAQLTDKPYDGPPIHVDNDYINEFLAFLSTHGLRRVAAGDLLDMGDAHNDPESACFDKNHVPPKHFWSNVLPLAKALESVRTTARTNIEVSSAYYSDDYNQCLNGDAQSAHLTFKAIGLRSRTLDSAQLNAHFQKLKEQGEFAGSITQIGDTLLLELKK